MSERDQREVYANLKDRKKRINNEMAAIESSLKAAVPYLDALSRSLRECAIGNLDWVPYQSILSECPPKAQRYGALKLELADIQAQMDKFVGFD